MRHQARDDLWLKLFGLIVGANLILQVRNDELRAMVSSNVTIYLYAAMFGPAAKAVRLQTHDFECSEIGFVIHVKRGNCDLAAVHNVDLA